MRAALEDKRARASKGFHLVLSDMAPDTAGGEMDAARSLDLARHAARIAIGEEAAGVMRLTDEQLRREHAADATAERGDFGDAQVRAVADVAAVAGGGDDAPFPHEDARYGGGVLLRGGVMVLKLLEVRIAAPCVRCCALRVRAQVSRDVQCVDM